jgi:hypothetical protein
MTVNAPYKYNRTNGIDDYNQLISLQISTPLNTDFFIGRYDLKNLHLYYTILFRSILECLYY